MRLNDKDFKQVVYTETALTQIELNEIQWWAYQPDIHPDNIIIYPGSDGLAASEGAAVYRPLRVDNDQVGGFITGLNAMSHWGIQVGRVLEAFVKCSKRTLLLQPIEMILRKCLI